MADTRALGYFRRAEPVRGIRASASTGHFTSWRRGETTVTQEAGYAVTITGGAIASAEAFGTTFLYGGALFDVGAIASAEALGTPALQSAITLTPTAVESAEAFGVLTVSPGPVTISSVGAIASGEQFGNAVDTGKMNNYRRGEVARFLLGRATNAGLTHFRRGDPMAGMPPYGQGGGAPVALNATAFLTAVGAIASREAFGTGKIAGPIANVGGIASAMAFGTPLIAITSAPRHRPIAATVTRVRVPAGVVAR